MVWDYALFFVFALGCEILGTVGGFGSSVLFVPLAGFVFPRPLVLGLTSILHVFSNISKVVLFRKYIHWKLTLLFGIPSLLLTLLGAWMAGWEIAAAFAEIVLGIFLVGFSLLFLLFPQLILPANKWNAIGSGALAGLAAGFLGTGGAIRGMALAAFNLEKELFVGTSAAIDFGVDLSRLFIYAEQGFMDGSNWIYITLLVTASWTGTWLGREILRTMTQDFFRKLVLLLIFTVGIATLLKVWLW